MESSKRTFVRTLVAAIVVASAFAAAAFAQAPPVKIGLLATLEGPFAAGGQDGMRGAELAVRQRHPVDLHRLHHGSRGAAGLRVTSAIRSDRGRP